MYSTTPSLTDPPADSPVTAGINWLQGIALGTTATAVAVLAVAAIGWLMLSGRLELRRGITVVIGCFVLFGATSVAVALTSFSESNETGHPVADADITSPLQTHDLPASAYDPYAGASVPETR